MSSAELQAGGTGCLAVPAGGAGDLRGVRRENGPPLYPMSQSE
jgi:hypothetical protein